MVLVVWFTSDEKGYDMEDGKITEIYVVSIYEMDFEGCTLFLIEEGQDDWMYLLELEGTTLKWDRGFKSILTATQFGQQAWETYKRLMSELSAELS